MHLCNDINKFHPKQISLRNINVGQAYKNNSAYFRALKRVHHIFRLPKFPIYFSDWKNQLSNYDTVFLQSVSIPTEIVKYIQKTNDNIRIIVWFMNPIQKTRELARLKQSKAELWTFDYDDARNYHLNYNTQYFFNNIILPKSVVDNDVYFLGADKGRIEELIQLEKELINKGISTRFHITSTGKTNNKYNDLYKSNISYEESLLEISKSNVIVDLLQDGQSGLTVRPLEALFFQKKLITNNTNVVNEKFYNKNNIFILGQDNINNIKQFVDLPYERVSSEIIEYYDYDKWLERFFEED